jgi:hypothetical protein
MFMVILNTYTALIIQLLSASERIASDNLNKYVILLA